jgi:hypothetical protein
LPAVSPEVDATLISFAVEVTGCARVVVLRVTVADIYRSQ